MLQTPIEFYGIVLDQHDKPVSAVNVSASVVDNMIKGSPLATVTDAGGRFTIRSKGMSMHIEVSKPGYDFVDRGGSRKSSSQGFDFGADSGRGIYPPDPSAPSIFHLRKAENPVSLERLAAQPKVPRDGSRITVSLSNTNNCALQISCLTTEDNRVPNAPYDWRCEVSVSGGTIQEVTDDQIHIAPQGEYAVSAVIDMPKTLDPRLWQSDSSRNYWLRFDDNTFGRIRFRMIAGGDHFAVIEGFRNPTPNERNLEPIVLDR